jgi:hypothetical protein
MFQWRIYDDDSKFQSDNTDLVLLDITSQGFETSVSSDEGENLWKARPQFAVFIPARS